MDTEQLLSRLDGPVPRNTRPAARKPVGVQARRAPLSFGQRRQRRIWFPHQPSPDDTAYHIGSLIEWPTTVGHEVQDLPADPGLVGYLVDVGEAPPPAELTARLRRTLSAYLVPSLFVVVPSMPPSANGKVARRAVAA